MKRIVSLWLMLTLLLGLCSCASPSVEQSDDRLHIVCTIFPLYDWTREVLGARAADVELTLLLDNGTDLHSFQPSADDIVTISECDLFIYVGGESDDWVTDTLKEARNQTMTVLNVMDFLGSAVKEEEEAEGMEPTHEDHEDGPEYDEHVWLSLRNADLVCEELADLLSELLPANDNLFHRNTDAYQAKLDELDTRYRDAADAAPLDTLLFGDRFPFRYLTDDYGLNYYAAFSGCSAETEASFETVVFLANKIDELGLGVILQTESSDGSIADTIRQATATGDQQILTLDSMQSITARQITDGVTYLDIMEQNLAVLSQALNTASN